MSYKRLAKRGKFHFVFSYILSPLLSSDRQNYPGKRREKSLPLVKIYGKHNTNGTCRPDRKNGAVDTQPKKYIVVNEYVSYFCIREHIFFINVTIFDV